MIYLTWMGSTVDPDLVCVNPMEFFLEFEENDTTNVFIDSAGNWDFTARTTSALAQTSAMSAAFGVAGRRGFPNITEGNTIYIPVASGFKFGNVNATFGGWFNGITSTGGIARFLMGNVGATATDFQMYIAIDGAGQTLHFYATTDGAVSGRVGVDSGAQLHATTFMLLTATLDRTNNQLVFRWRRADAGAMASGTAAFPSALYTGSTTANLCINDGLSSDSTYFSSDRAGVSSVDKAFYRFGEFTDDDFDFMFNGGVGRAYDEFEVCSLPSEATWQPDFADVRLLFHGNGANGSTTLTDSSTTPVTPVAFGNAQISTAQSKWGGSSALLDGSGDYWEWTTPLKLKIGTGQFAIQGWIYATTINVHQAIIEIGQSGAQGGIRVLIDSSNRLTWREILQSNVQLGSNVAITANTWYFFTVARDAGGNIRGFLGTSEATLLDTPTTSSNDLVKSTTETSRFGSLDGPTQGWSGYLADIRVVIGGSVPVPTDTFAVPDAAFPDS